MDEKQIAEAVAAYVEDNLHEDLCLESIADKLAVPNSISTGFSQLSRLYHI